MSENWWIIISIVILSIYVFFTIVEITAGKPSSNLWHRTVLVVCAMTWMRDAIWWPFIPNLAFILLDYLAQRKLVVKITDKKITLPTIPMKSLLWADLTNLVLKDGLLTIDRKDNRLFQQEVFTSDWDINEEEFNRYCFKKINNAD